MSNENRDGELAKRPLDGELVHPTVQSRPARSIQLGAKAAIDISNLSAREADALEAEAAKRAIERDDRQQRMGADLSATAAQLRAFSEAMNDTAGQNASVTITNTKEDSLGTTQIMIGNTDAARSGKLSRSQQGLGDNTRLWIILAAIVGAVIVLVAIFK